VDLLLLNASNLPDQAVYPYAFVQVSALARHHGLTVARFDFVRLNRQQIRDHLTRLIRRHRPRMIGLHLRQADSVVESDYPPPPLGDPSKYFLPVDDTRALVAEIRRLTRAPIVAGGFGFSAHPLQTAARLQVDFGVQGEPDGFFARFADVLAGRALQQVPNLIYRQGRAFHANPRVFYPPFDGPEYTDEVVDELIAFYGERSLLEGTMTTVPVEIARGCPFRCTFCNEPAVKGRRVRYRNWAAVEQDMATLASHGIRNLWFVCSEINIHPRRARAVAHRMAALNAGRDQNTRVRWRSYSIPRMAPADLHAMLSAGFQPAWSDFPSFDDANLARCRVPFRTRPALDCYCRYLDWADQQAEPPADRQIFHLFLGNVFANARTVSTTLRRVDALGLQARHEQAVVTAATRVFCVDGKNTCGDPRSLSTLGRRGRGPFDIVGPTFHFAPALVSQLGSERAVREFFNYVGSTFLSSEHQHKRNWPGFLFESISPAGLLALMRAARWTRSVAPVAVEADDARVAKEIQRVLATLWKELDEAAVRRLFAPGAEASLWGQVVHGVLIQLTRPNARSFARVLRSLGIPHNRDGFYDLSEYGVARILYRQFDSNHDVVAQMCRVHDLQEDSLDLLQLRYVLFENNVRIRPDYRPLLFGG
jgi:Fe-S oxidoreductase